MKKFEVLVGPKPEVLDAEGRAILSAAQRNGFAGIKSIRVSKCFRIELDSANDESAVREFADKVLANPVSQDFQIRKI